MLRSSSWPRKSAFHVENTGSNPVRSTILREKVFMVTWIMQQNLVKEPQKWYDALEVCGSKWKPVEIIPFADSVPDVDFDTKYAVAYGSTTMIKNAHKHSNWNPGVFFTPELFRSNVWQEKYGKNMFNSDGYVTTIEKLKDNCPDEMFIRPNNDLKDFSGSLIDKAGLIRFYDKVSFGGYIFGTDAEVFVAPIKEIHKEWRCFIVDGKVVASSQYKFRSMLMTKEGAPGGVIEFANSMANIWGPEKAYVMDVCEDMDRKLHLVELNCFNASGVYECNVVEIIKAVESMLKE